MRRVQQKISQGLDVIQYFTMREWIFDSTQYQRVFHELSDDDKKCKWFNHNHNGFALINYLFFDYSFFMDTRIIPEEEEVEYLKNSILGGRQYCLKEPLSSIPRARIHFKM
jgi:alcohol-forming fatty acyl-CoA reductase